MNYIEQVFRDKAVKDGCSILLSKWNYDSQLIPEALETIPLIFPHFSKHNKSHSETILNNVVNVLSKKVIQELSATDLWLLLESAYCHDLGMVITVDMIKEAIDGGAFLDYFRKIEGDSFHEMHKYSSCFEIKEGKIVLKEKEFSLNMYDSVRFLLSDYFRSRHAENSCKAVMHSDSVLSLDLPKAIVPARLINMMGEVCRAHTLDFNQVMLLPQVENGIATDVAHPRFIACLLRLGDILDIDNNRFSDIFLKTINEMPELSRLHRDKHLSINHLRIDNKYIEINARCSNPRVAKVTKDWFDWIKEEVNNQTLRWNTIVPDNLSCYLPTINALKIDVDGYNNLEGINMPKFTIDVDKAMELLQGKNFYQDPFDSIRELLQNAVDSTLIKVYELNKQNPILEKGVSQGFLDLAKHYPIEVSVNRNQDGKICISISDKGTGLSKSQLQYLSNTGSSSKNYRKQKIIQAMPDWMRPAGVFGIGFQSVFLLTNKVEITTKDFFTDECMSIEMYNPRSKMKGDIYVKPCHHIYESGFSISFELNDHWNAQELKVSQFDGVLTKSDRVDDICKKVTDYAKLSFFPIYCNEVPINRLSMNYYDPETGIELKFSDWDMQHTQHCYFKNAEINGFSRFPFFSIDANYHKGNSSQLLSLDRSAFKSGVADTMLSLLRQAVQNYIESKHFVPVYGQGINSFVLFSRLMNLENHLKDSSADWDFVFRGKKISEFLYYDKIIVTTTFSTNEGVVISEIANKNALRLQLNAFLISRDEEVVRVIIKIMSAHYKHCFLKRLFYDGRFICCEYILQNEDVNVCEIELSVNDFITWHRENLRVMPYIKDFEHLKITENQATDLLIDSQTVASLSFLPRSKVLRMISPFEYKQGKLVDKRNSKLYELVHSINGCSIDDIKVDYERLVKYVMTIEAAKGNK